MLRKFLILALIFCLVLAISELKAQGIINTTGDEISGNGGTVNYSVGQLVSATYLGSNGSVSSGIQQPYEIILISGFENTFGISLKCQVYPNPTTNFVILNIEQIDDTGLSYMLFDAAGKLIEQRKIKENETSISLSDLASSVYFLQVTDGIKELKTFKIIKK